MAELQERGIHPTELFKLSTLEEVEEEEEEDEFTYSEAEDSDDSMFSIVAINLRCAFARRPFCQSQNLQSCRKPWISQGF